MEELEIKQVPNKEVENLAESNEKVTEKMIEKSLNFDSLTDEEKSLITGIIFKIQNDEKTHKVLLSIIREVLNNKQ